MVTDADGPANDVVTAARLNGLHGVQARVLTELDPTGRPPFYACTAVVDDGNVR